MDRRRVRRLLRALAYYCGPEGSRTRLPAWAERLSFGLALAVVLGLAYLWVLAEGGF